MKRASSAGASKTKRTLPPSGVIDTILPDAVDMAIDQVAAQLVAELQRPFEVDAGCPASSRRDGSCRGVSPETSTANQSRALLDHGQAAARAGDRGADGDRRHVVPVRTTKRRSSALPPGLTEVISPMSVTMPVNMPVLKSALCPAFQRVAGQRTRRNQPEPGREIEPVEAQLARPQSGRRRPARGRPVAADAVDQPGLQEGRRDLPAAFDQHAGQAALRRAPAPPPRRRPGHRRRPPPRRSPHLPRCSASRAAAGAADVQTQPNRHLPRRRGELRCRRQAAPCESSTMRTGERPARPGSRQVSSGSSAADRAAADQDRVMGGAQALAVGARRLAGDPLAFARGGGDAPVERGRELEVKERPALAHPQQEAGVDLGRLAPHPRPPRRRCPPPCSRAWPCPFTRGSGSSSAETTRATPAATRASAQGGVRP